MFKLLYFLKLLNSRCDATCIHVGSNFKQQFSLTLSGSVQLIMVIRYGAQTPTLYDVVACVHMTVLVYNLKYKLFINGALYEY